jgi:hypothetical protein
MHQVTRVRPVNSLLFLSDPNGGQAPEPIHGAMIWSTPSCIAFVCYPEQDGPTEIVLGSAAEVDPGFQPSFAGSLQTPNHEAIVSTVDRQAILRANVPKAITQVKIWLNHSRWPDKVTIGLE